MTKSEQTINKLRQLRLNCMAEHFTEVLEAEKNHNRGFLWMLDHLLDLENESRWKRAIENRFRNSKLIDHFLISDFDFKFHPSREKHRSLILRLVECDFIEENKDVILIGHPGTGNYRKFLFMESN